MITNYSKQKNPFAWIREMAETDPAGLAARVLMSGKLARALAVDAIKEAHPELLSADQVEVPVEKI